MGQQNYTMKMGIRLVTEAGTAIRARHWGGCFETR